MKIFLQARVNSKRFPKKVLKEIYKKKNSLEIIIDKISKIGYKNDLVVLTSNKKSDNLIKTFCKKKKINCFRGPLDNVALRFLRALKKYKCNYFMRISADSPLIDIRLIKKAMKYVKENKYQIITNVCPRSFPKGQSVEIIKSSVYKDNYANFNKKKYLEHVTNFFYKNKKNFLIKNIKSLKDYSNFSLALDTKKDFNKIKNLLFLSNNVDRNFFDYLKV